MGSSGSGYSSEDGELSEDDDLEASRSYGESINTRLRPRYEILILGIGVVMFAICHKNLDNN